VGQKEAKSLNLQRDRYRFTASKPMTNVRFPSPAPTYAGSRLLMAGRRAREACPSVAPLLSPQPQQQPHPFGDPLDLLQAA